MPMVPMATTITDLSGVDSGAELCRAVKCPTNLFSMAV